MDSKKLIVLLVFILSLSIFFSSVSSNIVTINNSANFEQVEEKNTVSNFFEKFLDIYTKICRIPSMSTCIIDNSSIVWSKHYGYIDPQIKNKPHDDSIYLVMSISKPVAATALMQLWEQGLFDLDEDVNNYLPFSLRNPNYPDIPITFRMLLSHRSSLSYDEERGSYSLQCLSKTICLGDPDVESYPDPWLENYLCPGGNIYNPEVWVDEEPGSNYHYANVGYALIGYLVELISNEEFNEYCKNHIFTPLSMMNTSYFYKDLNNSNICIPYVTSNFISIPRRQALYSYLWAACTDLKTTINDLSKFIIAHMNGGMYEGIRILNKSTVDMMHKSYYPNFSNEENYGLGFQIHNKSGEKYYGHDGGGPGVHTRMLVRSSDNSCFIYLLTTSSMLTWSTSNFVEKIYFRQINRLT